MSEQEPETLPGLTTQTVLGAAGVLLTQVVATVVIDSLRQWDAGIILRVLQGILPRGGSNSLLNWLPQATDQPSTTWSSDTELDRAAWIEVLDGLTQHGVLRARVTYDGRSDGGKINPPAYTPDGLYVPKDLSAELRRLIEVLLPGLWNVGEGSHGEFVIDLDRRTITQRHIEHYLAARASRTNHTLPWGA